MDRIVSGITDDGSVVCFAIDSSDLVARAAFMHQTSSVASAALGRLLTAASLMGSQMKNKDENLTLRIKGEGPLGALIAVSDFDGNVRGYVENRSVHVPLTKAGFPDVGTAVGREGTLTVMKEFGKDMDPYVGTIELVSGEIAEDITAYYAYSEQRPTALALGVLVEKDNTVSFAGGFLAQLFPGAAEESIDRLEENISKMLPITTLLSQGKTPKDIIGIVLEGMDPNIINTMPVEYRCNCSRERVEKALISLGSQELQDLREEEEVIEVDCHFCNKKYRFNQEEVQKLVDQMSEKQ